MSQRSPSPPRGGFPPTMGNSTIVGGEVITRDMEMNKLDECAHLSHSTVQTLRHKELAGFQAQVDYNGATWLIHLTV